MLTDFFIQPLGPREAVPYGLMLLADPSREVISKYLPLSAVYLAKKGSKLIGCYAIQPLSQEETEIKNIAVAEKWQGKGVGSQMLADAITRSKADGYKSIRIGTANTSAGQLYLYQKMGFRISHVLTGYFTEHYPEPVYENGHLCKDMIVLRRQL